MAALLFAVGLQSAFIRPGLREQFPQKLPDGTWHLDRSVTQLSLADVGYAETAEPKRVPRPEAVVSISNDE